SGRPTRTSIASVPVAVQVSIVIPEPLLSHPFIGFGYAVSLPVAPVLGFAAAVGVFVGALAGALFCELVGVLVQPKLPKMVAAKLNLTAICNAIFILWLLLQVCGIGRNQRQIGTALLA